MKKIYLNEPFVVFRTPNVLCEITQRIDEEPYYLVLDEIEHYFSENCYEYLVRILDNDGEVIEEDCFSRSDFDYVRGYIAELKNKYDGVAVYEPKEVPTEKLW